MPSPIRLLKRRLDALRVLETSFPRVAPNGDFVGRATHILLTYTPKNIRMARECDQLTIDQYQELFGLCYEVLEIASRKEKGHA